MFFVCSTASWAPGLVAAWLPINLCPSLPPLLHPAAFGPPAPPAGFPQLYFYMLAQRRKVLRSGRSASASKLKHQ
jgi:hypothetical protein